MTQPEDLKGEARKRWEIWTALGLSEAAAMDQVRADGLLPAGDPVDTLTESFRALGLSDEAARVAAVGRDDEVSMRRRARAAGAPADARRRETREAERRADLAELEALGQRIRVASDALRSPSTRRLLDGR
jgi:hypothetical protein